MSDIVERLRRWTHAVDAQPACELMDEAAAELERLRWHVKTLESAAKYAAAMLRERERTAQTIAESDSSRAVGPERDKTSAETHLGSGSVTLTDAEREAVEKAAAAYRRRIDDGVGLLNDGPVKCGEIAATLRNLLERLA